MSDFHGHTMKLPKADLVVVTGDMLPEFSMGAIDPQKEKIKQGIYTKHNKFRESLADPDVPVVAVNGNHCWVPYAPWIQGAVYEIGDKPCEFTVLGYRFGGMRGVPIIMGTAYANQLSHEKARRRADQIPNGLDFLVTHSPPLGILDGRGARFGLSAINTYLNRQIYDVEGGHLPRAHFFGHVHECFDVDTRRDEDGRQIVFSNAATGFHLFDFDGKELKLLGSKRIM